MAECKPDLSNVSMLNPAGFKLSIIAQEFKFLEYFCVAASMPGVTQSAVAGTFRNQQYRIPGETVAYNSLSVTFIVDEEMKNYSEIFEWIKFNSCNDDLKYNDMTLSILSNQKSTNKQITFEGAIPVALSGIEFNVQNTDVEYVQCNVEFEYNSFSFVD